MPDQVSKAVQAARMQQITELETELRGAYFQSLIGQRLQVLVESAKPFFSVENQNAPPSMLLRGTACRYAPAEWIAEPISIDQRPSLIGKMVATRAIAGDTQRVMVSAVAS